MSRRIVGIFALTSAALIAANLVARSLPSVSSTEALPSLAIGAVVLIADYGLWTLAVGRSGRTQLLLALVFGGLSASAVAFSESVQRVPLYPLQLALLLVAMLGLIAPFERGFGLLSTRLVAAWVAWVGLTVAALALAANALTVANLALGAVLVPGSGAAIPLMAALTFLAHWTRVLMTPALAVFWSVLGLTLVLTSPQESPPEMHESSESAVPAQHAHPADGQDV